MLSKESRWALGRAVATKPVWVSGLGITAIAAGLIRRYVDEGAVEWDDVIRLVVVVALLYGLWLTALFVVYRVRAKLHGMPSSDREIVAALAELARKGENLRDLFESLVVKGAQDMAQGMYAELGQWHDEVIAYLQNEPRLGKGFVARVYGREHPCKPPFPQKGHHWSTDQWCALDRKVRHLRVFQTEFPRRD
jgi:hypothetical protein